MSATEALSVVSINTGLANGFGDYSPVARFSRLSEELRQLPSRPDVILCQEVDMELGWQGLESVVADLGADYQLVGADTYSKRHTDRASAAITRLRVVDNIAHEFQGSRSGMGLQVLHLEDELAGQVAVANAYLEADPWRDLLRCKKLGEIARLFDEKYEGLPQIVAGDFNATLSFPSLKYMLRQGFVAADTPTDHFTFPTDLSAEQIVKGGCQKPFQYNIVRGLGKIARGVGGWPEHRISAAGLLRVHVDHILARNIAGFSNYGVVHDVTGDKLPFSDHCGIRVDVELTKQLTGAKPSTQTQAVA